MTPLLQLRLAEALQSIYASAPTPPGWTLLDREFVPADPAMPVSLLLKDEDSGKTAKIDRGSITWWDWWQDFRAVFVDSPFGVGKVEAGFNTYNADARTESGRPLPPVDLLVGHSLGGPDSTYDMSAQEAGRVELLLIESPMPGDATFCAWASKRSLSTTIWRNLKDVVTDAPPALEGWRQITGDLVALDFRPLGPPDFDPLKPIESLKAIVEFNHSILNCISAFKRQYELP